MLNLNSYICALDIGSSKIAACVAEIKKKRINRIFFEALPSKSVKKGQIGDSIDLVGSVTKVIKNLKVKSGIKIKFVNTNISGQDIITKHSRAIVPLAERGNKMITVSDMQRANEEARILGSSLDEEVVHMMPSGYTIDSKGNIINPLGLYSHRLEVDLYLVCAKLSSVQSLSRVINQSGYEIKDLFFSGLATSRAVFDRSLKEGLNLFCDIGADTTELLVFRNGVLKEIDILQIGGDDLTAQLQDALKIPFDLAEDIKRSYGLIGEPGEILEDKEILVKKTNLYKPIRQRLVVEIVTSKAKLICSQIKDAVEKKVSCYEVDNFVIVGRTALLEGFIERLENTLAIPVRLGRIADPEILSFAKEESELTAQKYLTYLTCLGMILESMQDKSTPILPNQKPVKNCIKKAIARFKEAYQEYF
ncbi:MAG: cell division protein FtsA [Candidatus Omnitrophota bacterium]